MKLIHQIVGGVVLSLLLTVSVSATPQEGTIAFHGVELPGEVASVLPFPAHASVGSQRKILSTYYVNFTFDAPWPQVLEFFSSRLR